MIKYIKKYSSLINESVIELDAMYVVNGIKIKKSIVTSYKRKVKEQTGKDLSQMYSDSQIAEELMYYIVDKHADVETLPISALIGGEESMEEVPMENEEPESEEPIEAQPTEEPTNPSEENLGTEQPEDDFETVSNEPAPAKENTNELPL